MNTFIQEGRIQLIKRDSKVLTLFVTKKKKIILYVKYTLELLLSNFATTSQLTLISVLVDR